MACLRICSYWVIRKRKTCQWRSAIASEVKLQTDVLQHMILMVWNSLQNISPEQSGNKKFQDYLEEIQDPFKEMAWWEKAFRK